MNNSHLTYKTYGEDSILIEWPQDINEQTLKEVLLFKSTLVQQYSSEKIYIKSAYASILVTYDQAIEPKIRVNELKSLYAESHVISNEPSRLWEIPVCYDTKFGLDLSSMAEQKECRIEEIIDLHSRQIYTVYFTGFLPGFLYLGGLDPKLHCPRKSKPRLRVSKGAVAIGGQQTGIYPIESPAGWNIIGNSPLTFFDASNEVPCFAQPRDKLQFIPISLNEYESISIAVKSNRFQIKYQLIND